MATNPDAPDEAGQSYFRVQDEDDTGGRYEATAATVGPWSPQLQHGGPPNALLVRAAERAAAALARDDHLVALRLAAEFVGPAPVAPVEVRTEVVRAARSAVLVGVTLSAGDRVCLHGRVWLLREADTSAVATPPAADEPAAPLPPTDGPGAPPTGGWGFGYGRSVDWWPVAGRLDRPGPATVWARPRPALVGTEPLSGLQRVVLVADSSSGISAELSWDEWSFTNVDLDVHLARPVVGDWVRLAARTVLGGHGSALARSDIADLSGPVGSSAQTLLLAPLRRD